MRLTVVFCLNFVLDKIRLHVFLRKRLIACYRRNRKLETTQKPDFLVFPMILA
jgi:hypothetical protein